MFKTVIEFDYKSMLSNLTMFSYTENLHTDMLLVCCSLSVMEAFLLAIYL